MRKTFLLLLLCAGLFNTVLAQSEYYWYKGEKMPLTRKDDQRFVLFKNENITPERRQKALGDVDVKASGTEALAGITPYKGRVPKMPQWAIVETKQKNSRLSNREEIAYEAPAYVSSTNAEAVLSNLLYVKLKHKNDLQALEQAAKKHKVDIVGSNEFMPLWYTLACNEHSTGTSLEIANSLYESNVFEAAEPDFVPLKPLEVCTNDPFFDNQWGLNNNSNNPGSGVDIKLCEARELSTGNGDVTIAVIDHGMERNHPDLPNLSPFSYDTPTGDESTVRGNHGMPCGGIIGAAADNNIGVAGIAPDCPLMDISDPLWVTVNAPQQLANGFNFAWTNGAAVISNSWGHNLYESAILDDAIDNTITNGRGGLGTVVVFSAGNINHNLTNPNTAVIYPANSNPDIIVVGAISPCGERTNPNSCDSEFWWGSCFGPEVDVMAPGVLVPTTDRQGANGYRNGDYNQAFNGTSAACPHVAAIAGLMLSENPSLTQGEVATIIEQTAQKVGNYNYQNTAGRTNGTWHTEVGYGMVDAEAAVLAANDNNGNDLLAHFNVPRPTGIPQGFYQYSNVHTIGTGGPSLDNVFNSVFNWWGSTNNPNGLYQLTLETTDGNPSHFTDLSNFATYTLHLPNPEISISSGTGFANIDGDYWVTLDGNNLVLVEKSGNYALYFSNSPNQPNMRLGGDDTIALEGAATSLEESETTTAYPNPFSSAINVAIPSGLEDVTVMVTNSKGQQIEMLTPKGRTVSLGENYTPGVYILKITSSTTVEHLTVVKQ
ncbi:S8 family peptidase [Cytophagaceae bacterium ABcell3]|nr:S8 family peptidase [Cytophagaceae bacterium ABcell3]